VFFTLHGRQCPASNISHLVTEEVFRPILDVTEHVEPQRLQFCGPSLPTAEINRHII